MTASQRRLGLLLSYVSMASGAFVALALVPLLLSHWSTTEFGIFELAGSVVAYLVLFDAGFSVSLTREFVRVRQVSPALLPSLLSTSVIIYSALTVLASAAIMVIWLNVDVLFGATFSATDLEQIRQLLLLVVINCFIILPGNWLVALITATERFVFLRVIVIVKHWMQLALTALILVNGGESWSVLLAQTLMNAGVLVLHAAFVIVSKDIRLRFGAVSRTLLVRMSAFSAHILLIIVFDLAFWRTGQVVVGATLGAASVATFALITRLVSTGFLQLSSAASGIFLPHLSAVAASGGDRLEVNRLFVSVGRLQAILGWGAIGLFAALGELFVALWAGDAFEAVYPGALVLMLALSVSAVQSLGNQLMQAEGRLMFRSVLYALTAGLFILIAPAVANTAGVVGVAVWGAVLLFISTGVILNVYYHRALGLDVIAFGRRVGPLVIPAIVGGGMASLFSRLMPSGWVALLACSCVYAVAYASCLWPLLTRGERLHLRGLFRL